MTIRGGKRIGAGRKANSGKFKDKIQEIRVPSSYIEPLKQWLNKIACMSDEVTPRLPYLKQLNTTSNQRNLSRKQIKPLQIIHQDTASMCYEIPFYDCTVSAGLPSPVDDSFSITMDLNKHLIQNTPATFFVRTSGESLLGAGIRDGDLLVVDRSLTDKIQDIVIAAVNSDLTVKRLIMERGHSILKAESPEFSNIELSDDMAASLWGVVTDVIHSLRV